MRLLHLSAVGPNVPAATLEFAPRLTVVYGASEAGKSYVIEALDFMFGAARLRDIPESAGYQHLLLGIEFGTDDIVTLIRRMRGGGRISVFEEDVRSLPQRPADKQLEAKHRKDDSATISYFLLDRLGIADAKLRKNKRNEVIALSFRNIAHLLLIDEERMQSRTSPVQTGNYTTRTTERSALKLLLSGDDDSGLEMGEDPAVFRRVNRGQVEVLDRAIAQARSLLGEAPGMNECRSLLTLTSASIEQSSASMSIELAARDRIVARREGLIASRRRQDARASDAAALFRRFSLLDEHYKVDLGRLEMVKRAGTLLGYFDAEACVFCGALAEHQQREHAVYETVQLAESVDAEANRTQALREDLAITLSSVEAAVVQTRNRSAELGVEIASVTDELRQADLRLLPSQEALRELIDRRSEIEGWLAVWRRIADLEELRASVAGEKPVKVDSAGEGLGVSTQRDFSLTLRGILLDWQVPGAAEAGFENSDPPDVVLQQRRRADRGKGMRSILHAAFSVALSEYCLDRDLPHPGFVALDTPVLTYRDPDAGPSKPGSASGGSGDDTLADGDEELMSVTVAQAFYDFLAKSHSGQSLVMENQTPPLVDADGCKIVYFTGNAAHGRAGFYPG